MTTQKDKIVIRALAALAVAGLLMAGSSAFARPVGSSVHKGSGMHSRSSFARHSSHSFNSFSRWSKNSSFAFNRFAMPWSFSSYRFGLFGRRFTFARPVASVTVRPTVVATTAVVASPYLVGRSCLRPGFGRYTAFHRLL